MSVVSAEDQRTIETSVSPTGSIVVRSPSPFVRPSNPQSRFLDSSSEGSVAAPTVRRSIPSPPRRRPALTQISNAPRTGRPSPSRTPRKVGRAQGAEQGVPTPPPSVRPKLAKHRSRFPLIAPITRLKDESDSPIRPARRCVSLHFTDCSRNSDLVLSLLPPSSLDGEARLKLQRTHRDDEDVIIYTYYVAALGPKG